MKLTVLMPVPNFSNQRWHWRKRAAVVKEQRNEVSGALYSVHWASSGVVDNPTLEKPWRVTLTRLSRGTCDDDGVVSSMKPTRDAVAAFVGVDDKHRNVVRYEYRQRKSKEQGVEIHIEQLEGPHELAD